MTANYRQPFLFAVVLHIVLLTLLLFEWPSDVTKNPPAGDIVQATLITTLPSPPTPLPQTAEESIKEDIKENVETAKPVENPMPIQEKAKPEPLAKLPSPTLTPDPPVSAGTEPHPASGKEALLEKQAQTQKKLQDEITHQLEAEQQQAAKKQHKTIEKLLENDLAHTAPTAKSSSKRQTSTRVSDAASTLDNPALDQYKGLIISAISHHWIVPETVKKGLVCRLKVRVAPGGVVTAVTLVKSSGNAALDRSAESAVYKASPLPVPKEKTLFNAFREFNLVVRPEGILAE